MKDQGPTGKNISVIHVPKASFPCLPKAHTSQEGKDPTGEIRIKTAGP